MDSDPGPPVVMLVPDNRQMIVEISLRLDVGGDDKVSRRAEPSPY